MARSLGDQVVKPIGVLANPEVVERDIDFKKDRFVILASNGVWEFLSSEEVVHLIEASSFFLFLGGGVEPRHFIHNSRRFRIQLLSPQEAFAAGGHEPAFAACEKVINKAAELWHQMQGTYRDDITIIVLRLPCF